MFSFLPSYVGSKKHWVKSLAPIKGSRLVEPFAGSAILSANLGASAILNDLDPMIFRILSQYDKQIVPDVFSKTDYFSVRSSRDWWRYAYCLQKMSFSGVFRYSKNGYNVPPKPIWEIKVREEFETNLARWKKLAPVVLNKSFSELDTNLFRDAVVILDPPYLGSSASYNSTWNGEKYLDFVNTCMGAASSVVIFDKRENLSRWGFKEASSRSMCVNGKYATATESVAVFHNGSFHSSIDSLFGQLSL